MSVSYLFMREVQKINVAVVGLGFMGLAHLRAYREIPHVRIAAVCGRSRLPVHGVLAGVAGNIKKTEDIDLGAAIKVYRELDALLVDPEIDVVDICTPTPMHAGQVITALNAGKHVICEKPLARSSVAAREILQVAEGARGRLMPAMCMRFWPGWKGLKQIVAEKKYGEVLAARFRRVSEMPAWSKGGTYAGNSDLGGALFDLHIHDTDFVNYLFGRPISVFSSGVIQSGGIINHVVTHYQYEHGPAVHAEGSWLLAGGFDMAYTLSCERATLDYELARGAEAMIITEGGKPPQVMDVSGPDGYQGELEYFMRCLAEERPSEAVTAQDSLVALEICEAEEKSLRTGLIVKL
jgi:predicted dehydrogenase